MEKTENKYIDRVMTGSYDINKFLRGGYEKGVITLFYGPPAAGKSNFTMMGACHQAKKNKKVIFIDTEGSFSYDRVKQLTMGIPEMALKNIIIIKPTSFSEQGEVFEKLSKASKSVDEVSMNLENIDLDIGQIGLIIVDSMTLLYRLELAVARKKGLDEVRKVNSELAGQMKYLHEIALKKDIPIIITAQVYHDFLTEEEIRIRKEPGVHVIGGDILKYWSKCIIELESGTGYGYSGSGGKKRMIIRKHRSIPEKNMNYEIVNEGVRKKGWLI